MNDPYENDRLAPDPRRLRDLADELDREGLPDLADATRRAANQAEDDTAVDPDGDPER